MNERDELVARLQTETRYVGLTRAVAAAADQIERYGREIERLKLQNIQLRNAIDTLGSGLVHLDLVLGPMKVAARVALSGEDET